MFETFLNILANNFMEFIVTLFLGGLTFLGKKFFQVFKENVEINKREEERKRKLKEEKLELQTQEQEVIKQGLLALLRFRINRLCVHVRDNNYMSVDEQRDLEDLYSAYKALGGNSRTHIVYNKIMNEYGKTL